MYKCYLFGELLPVIPEKLTLKIKGKNSKLSLLEGEVNVLKTPGLTEITLPVVLPVGRSEGKAPEYYLRLFERAMAEKQTTRLVMTRSSPDGKRLFFDTNMKVSLEDYSIKEDAENGLDLTVDLKLKQYRDYGTKTLQISTGTSSTGTSAAAVVTVETPREEDNAPSTRSYTVAAGDTLWGIAKHFYGNGALYTKIFDANRDRMTDPNVLYAGWVLVIP